MPSISDMFPTLDYDTLNRGLNFINFNLPSSFTQQQYQGFDPSFDNTGKFKDGVPITDVNNIEVTEKQLPVDEKEWDKLTRSERIERVMHESSGMPITSQVNLSILRRMAKELDKKGMYRESIKLQTVANNFTKSITLNESEIDGDHNQNATVTITVDENGQPITINKSFGNIEEAQDFYDKFVFPGMEEIKQLESSMSHFGFEKEAVILRRFLRAVNVRLPEKKAEGLSIKQQREISRFLYNLFQSGLLPVSIADENFKKVVDATKDYAGIKSKEPMDFEDRYVRHQVMRFIENKDNPEWVDLLELLL